MTKQPILNALAAIAYIIIVASVMHYGSTVAGNTEDTLFAPIAIISLFTLSAAVMGYIFLAQPVQLYLDDKKKEAIKLFMQTVGAFAVLTAISLGLLFSGVLA